jgi:hypothetical protein
LRLALGRRDASCHEEQARDFDARDKPVDDYQIIITKLRNQGLKDILDAKAALEVRMIDVVAHNRVKVDELVFQIEELGL